MRRAFATCCVCWLAWCGAPHANTRPLAYGMTPADVEHALNQPLIYHSGRASTAIYVAAGPAGIPGAGPSDAGIVLQFRNGRLTGWKKDWQLHRP